MTEQARQRQAVGLCKDDYPRPCGQDLAQVEDKCKVTRGENNAFRDRREDQNSRLARRARRERKSFSPYQVRNKTWKDENCRDMLFNLNRNTLENAGETIDNLSGDARDYLEELINDLPGEAVQAAAATIPARVARKAGCAVFGPLAWACGAVAIGIDAYELANEALDVMDQIDGFRDEIERLKDLTDDADRIREGLADPEKMEQFKQEKLQEMQDAATNNPCLKARQCFLTPYSTATEQGAYTAPGANRVPGRESLMDRFGSGMHRMGDPRGCCPGMTGHHLVYDSWTSGGPCDKYRKGDAPTVCVVGANQRDGSHAVVHREADAMLREHMLSNNCAFDIDDAVAIGTDSLTETIGGHCDPDCIEKQLEDYYKDAGCGNSQLNPKTSNNEDLSGICSAATS